MDSQINHLLVRTGGTSVAFAESGTGRPLLLVHGLGGPAIWSRVLEPLARIFRTVILHLPGFGSSGAPPLPFPTLRYAAVLDETMSTLGLDRPVVVGISYGAQIAATAAMEYPGRIGQLVLIAPTGVSHHAGFTKPAAWFFLHNVIKYLVFRNVRLTCALGSRSFYDLHNRPENLCRDFLLQFTDDRKIDAWLGALRDALVSDPAWVAKLQSLTLPTLILGGKEDRLVPCTDAVRLSQSLPHATLALLDECGHSLPLEKPLEMAECITGFVSRSSLEGKDRALT